jgi:hypothetical protein
MQRRATRLQVPITSLLSYVRFGHTETLIEVVILEEFVGDIAALIAPWTSRPAKRRNKHNPHAASVKMVGGRVQRRGRWLGIAPEFHKRISLLFQTLKSRAD